VYANFENPCHFENVKYFLYFTYCQIGIFFQNEDSTKNGNSTSAATREGMNDLYHKIDKYVYEIQIIELDEYLYGMNIKKIDTEKAYEMIIDAPNSKSDATMNVWKAYFVDPEIPCYKSSRVEKNEIRVNAFYRKAVDLDIERMAVE